MIPSNALSSAPAYVSTSANTQSLGLGLDSTVNASHAITGYAPGTLMFAATDGSNNIHIYGLNLASVTTPTATQIGSFSMPMTGATIASVICSSSYGFTNLMDPTTMFVLLQIAPGGGCSNPGATYEVVHYSDGTTTAPVSVTVPGSAFTPLYAPSGALAGMLLLDPVGLNAYVYADTSFSSPTVAVTGGNVSALSIIDDSSIGADGSFAGTTLFFAATRSAVQTLFRLPYSSSVATSQYTATGVLAAGVQDDSNIYFTDTVSTGSTVETIQQLALAGGSATQLFTYTVPATGEPYLLIGSDNSTLVMLTDLTNAGTGVVSSTLATLPVGTASSSTGALGGTFTGFTNAFMAPATPGDRSSDLVFVSAQDLVSGEPYVFSSAVLTPANVSKQALTPQTYFIDAGTSELSGQVLQLTGITGTPFGMGGGPINAVSIATLASTPLKSSGGATYTNPAGYDPGLVGLSNFIGAGVDQPQSSADGNPLGLAYDLNQHLIAPIAIVNTSVALL